MSDFSPQTTEESIDNFELLPHDDRLVVERDVSEETYHNLIFIPQKAQQDKVIGTVIAVGPGKMIFDPVSSAEAHEPMLIQKGQRILFGTYSGTDINWGGKKITIIRAGDVIATIRDKSDAPF